ncbi:MAG: DUF2461 domain-containing protein [Saprospiraceae bacterium]|jgi:uncharacterized protein (TIGR02453 family)|nr:DUF2461 domain-containing protein [Saprospiraceae bacterium]
MIQQTTLEFLKKLKQNNNKPWFDAHRKQYDNVKADYLACAGAILSEMKRIDVSLDMVTPKDCVFRINRDIRFSSDKSPYKTNLGIALHPGGKKFNKAAYYLHIEPDSSFIGGGLWLPEAALLSKVRKEINYFYADLRSILDNPEFMKTYGDLDVEEGQKLVRPPKGYDADNPAIEYLKLKSFTISAPVSDALLTSDTMVSSIIKSFSILKPFLSFINRGLMSDDEGGI